MMKIKFKILLLYSFTLLSCNGQQIKKDKETQSKTTVEKEQVSNIIKNENCDSVFVSYYTDGRKKEEGCLLNGKKNGVWRFWSFPEGYIDRDIVTSTYKNGILTLEIDTCWRTNSKQIAAIDSTIYYTVDSSYTKSTSFHKNGKLKQITADINGHPVGISRIWAENGNLMYEDVDEYKKCISAKTYNPQNNMLILEEYFRKKCQVEYSKEYDPETGKLLNEKRYKEGKLIFEKKY
jgi:antitoxin component YwqK of YwqJK toxin-antitoxin module